jgi:hypothetical protein
MVTLGMTCVKRQWTSQQFLKGSEIEEFVGIAKCIDSAGF